MAKQREKDDTFDLIAQGKTRGQEVELSTEEEDRLNELLPVAIRLTRRMKLALSGHFRRQGMSLSVGIRTVMQEYMRANGIK